MSKYSEIALNAAIDLNRDCQLTPQVAWKINAEKVFPNEISAQKKSCPKSAFLGLCEQGYVKGVKPGSYTRSKINKAYAIEGLNYLKADPALSENELWHLVSPKTSNEQMTVVKTLYVNGYIVE